MKTVMLLFLLVLLSLYGALMTSSPALPGSDRTTRSDNPPSHSWQRDASCAPACSETLNAVDMVSATDGWAVGDGGTILHWDGTQWHKVASPTTTTLRSVDMVSARDGWAVGGDTGYIWTRGILLHWDGSEWEEASAPGVNLQSVSMVSANDGWAVGYRYIPYGHSQDITLRLDDVGWQVYADNMDGVDVLVSVSMSSADYGWIASVGWYETAKLLQWNGTRWGYQDALWVESPILLNAVAADAQYGGWAVGEGFVNLDSFEKWPTSPSSPLNAVALVSQNDAWAVGTDGVIYHWDGTDWRTAASPTRVALRAVAMVSATEGWAVGEGGVILHYTAALPGTDTPTPFPTSTNTPTPTNTPAPRLYLPLILTGELLRDGGI